jgi:hypothetical protein
VRYIDAFMLGSALDGGQHISHVTLWPKFTNSGRKYPPPLGEANNSQHGATTRGEMSNSAVSAPVSGFWMVGRQALHPSV